MPRPEFWQEQSKRRYPRACAVLFAASTSVGLIPDLALAGVWRDDVAQASHTALAAQADFAAAGSIISNISAGPFGGSGVLISDRWVLTAGHLAKIYYNNVINDPTSISFGLSNGSYNAGEWFTYPGFISGGSQQLSNGTDLALLHLTSAVSGITPAVRYSGSIEFGATATMVGVGFGGVGSVGEDSATYPFGTKRAGNNTIDALGNVFIPSLGTTISANKYLVVDFDKPNDSSKSTLGVTTPLPLEYLVAHADSGGPWFINDNNTMKVAGITSVGSGQNQFDTVNSKYGSLAAAIRVSQFNTWIDDQLTARFWNNASGGAFDTGGNWDEGSAPGSTEIAVFNIGGSYTATLAGNINNKRIRVRNGNPTLNLGASTYALGSSPLESSLAIARTASDNASLTINNGTLSAVDVNIAESSGTTGKLTIASGGTLAASNVVAVGGFGTTAGGTGTLQIDSGGAVQINGGLRIHAAGRVTNAGSVSWSGGSINLTTGGTISNLAGGVFDSRSNGAISASSAINFANAGTFRKSVGTGTTSISIPVVNTGTIQVQSGSLALSAGGSSSGGTFNASASTYLEVVSGTAFTLSGPNTVTGAGLVAFGPTVSNSGTLKIEPGPTLLAITSLGNTGTIDLNNRLVINYSGISPIDSIKTQLTTGFANGTWNGAGIRSSLATTIAGDTNSTHKTAVGYAEASAFGTTTFGAVTGIDTTALLLRYTFSGDANLDGIVNGTDFTLLAANFNQSSRIWSQGDFNYDGKVNAMDFNSIAMNFGSAMSADLPAFALGSLVPEPQTLASLAAMTALGARRRRLE